MPLFSSWNFTLHKMITRPVEIDLRGLALEHARETADDNLSDYNANSRSSYGFGRKSNKYGDKTYRYSSETGRNSGG